MTERAKRGPTANCKHLKVKPEFESITVDLISDEMVDAFYLVGSVEYCKERVMAYRNAGVDLPLLLPRLEDFENITRTTANKQGINPKESKQ